MNTRKPTLCDVDFEFIANVGDDGGHKWQYVTRGVRERDSAGHAACHVHGAFVRGAMRE